MTDERYPLRVEGLLARSLRMRVCENMPGRRPGNENGEKGMRGMERGKRHLLPPALPRVSLRGGLTPCVGATRIPSGSKEEEEEVATGEREREREREEE